MNIGPYSDQDTARLVRLFQSGVPHLKIAGALDRTLASVENKISLLRSEGRIGQGSQPPAGLRTGLGSGRVEPCIELRGDDELVERVIGEGGFPVAVLGRGWLNLAGRPWAHTPDHYRSAA